ncbi:GSCOCG00001095001-RA-CDS [Cotesia congregata]|uniref:E3 ubiquitin-protein ligase n=1 Tax=Cotesia congregata TaxID=51543 RepID=A0A8J2HDS1_COTCN|nr:GSCOCG00001095001-RA-CDS [Cotesia congregata]CAG5096125.1 Similar to RNF146: E3 ubiquitin-protein ligase RNF146 (Macaca fascicularis) [Cotesia congregata]
MAQAKVETIDLTEDDKTESQGNSMECAVCLQTCVHPARLPCSHVFCYLCVKGVANQSKKCPMCRQEIPPDFVEKPNLIEVEETKQPAAVVEDEYQWFYEGRNGWWRYDPRTNRDLEKLFQLGHNECQLLICGAVYCIDFQNYRQFPKLQPARKRNIKRNTKNIPHLGVAGWWQYDQRTSLELETAYKQGKRTYELLIAGFLYIADFGSMLQLRRNDPSRQRRIKRDLSNAPKKGIAGLRLNQHDEEPVFREIRGAERSVSPASDITGTGDGASTPVPPSNTPQTPAGHASGDATPLTDRTDQRADSLHQVLEQMRSLMLTGHLSLNSDNEVEETTNDGSFSDHHSSSSLL